MKVKNIEIQEMVIEKTREMIISRGLKGWNMVDLAQKTGLAKQTLYKIIGSKERVIERVVLSQMEYTFGSLNKVLNMKLNFIETMELFKERIPQFISDVPRITLPEIYREYPAIEKKAVEFQEIISKNLIEFIERGMKEKYFRDDIEAEFLFDLMRGGVLEHYIRSGYTGDNLKNALITAYSCILNGILVNNLKK